MERRYLFPNDLPLFMLKGTHTDLEHLYQYLILQFPARLGT